MLLITGFAAANNTVMNVAMYFSATGLKDVTPPAKTIVK